MEFYSTGNARGTSLARFVNSAAGLDMDIGVEFEISYSFAPAESEGSGFASLSESTVSARVAGAAKISCMLLFPTGIEMASTDAPLPEETFLADLRQRLNEEFKDRFGAEVDVLELKGQSLPAPEAERWNRLLENYRLASDPKLAAEEMLRKSGLDPDLIGTVHVSEQVAKPFEPLLQPNAAADPSAPRTVPPKSGNRWVCTCGRENTGNFCPDCGSRKNYANWICVCGSRNTGKFCPECGNAAVVD